MVTARIPATSSPLSSTLKSTRTSKNASSKRCALGKGFLALSAGAIALVVSGCDSSSDPDRTAQAIDGFLVNSAVSFDDRAASAETGAAGRFTKLRGTRLMHVSGGSDVGFDDSATSGGMPFVGQLAAPTTLDFVTPLSTLAVELSLQGNAAEFDPENFAQAQQDLGIALGVGEIDFNLDPSTDLETIKLNAQLHQVLAGMADTPDAYGDVTEAFADVIRNAVASGETISLTDNVGETIRNINIELVASGSTFQIDEDRLEELGSEVAAINTNIAGATEPDLVAAQATQLGYVNAALTINRDTLGVSLQSSTGTVSPTLSDFESSELTDGAYKVKTSLGLNAVSFETTAFLAQKNLSDLTVSLGFEIVSTTAGDQRKLVLTTEDGRLSMTEGDSSSIAFSFPEGSIMNLLGIDATGTSTEASIISSNQRVFSTDGGGFAVNLSAIRNNLEDEGLSDILDSAGNYKVTVVIGGLKVNESSSGVVTKLEALDVSIDDDRSVSGIGVQGYVTFQ